MEDVATLIVGAWRHVHSVIIGADGEREYPYGESAFGYIYYSDTGIMAVQISRKVRTEVKDASGFKHDYLAYFGRYEIDTAKQVVRHFVEGQLFPGDHQEVLERAYHFYDEFMLLRPVTRRNYEILWQRVR